MKKKVWVVLILIIVVGAIVLGNFQSILNCVSLMRDGITFGKEGSSQNVDHSCFHEVYRDEDYSYYRCSLVICNHEDKVKTISVKGILPIDYLCGYIKTPFLDLVDSNNESYRITLHSKESYTFEVVFRTERGKTDFETLKFNRSMPWIVLE